MFRRKQDEDDPFASLKDAAHRGSATVTTGNTTASDSVGSGRGVGDGDGSSAAQVSGMPGSVRDQRRSNGFLVLLTIVLSLGGAAAAVWATERHDPVGANGMLGSSGSAVVGDGSGSSPGNGAATTESGNGKPPRAAHYDLLRPATFQQALNGVQRKLKPGERVFLIRLAPDRININSRLRDGRQGLIDVDDELRVETTVAGSAGERRGIALPSIDPQGPSRAVRKAARLGGFPAGKLDYLVLLAPTLPGEAAGWSLFFKGVSERNSHWTASLDGRTVYRPGEQPGSSSRSSSSGGDQDSLTIRTDSGTTTLTGADARRVTECVRKAGSDGQKIQDCLP